MTPRRAVIFGLLMLPPALPALGRATAPTAPDPAAWVPADALAYVGIADLDVFSTLLRRTALYQLADTPAAGDLDLTSARLLRAARHLRARLAGALAAEPTELSSPFGGSLALYVAGDDELEQPEVVLIVGVADHDLMRDHHARAVEKLRQIADTHEVVGFGEYSIDCFARTPRAPSAGRPPAFDEAELPPQPPQSDIRAALNAILGGLLSSESVPNRLAVCLTGNRLIVALTPQRVIAALRVSDATDSLARSPAYQTLLRVFKPVGQVRFVINLPRLFERMAAVGGAPARQALTLLGAESLDSLIGELRCGGTDFDVRCDALVLTRGQPHGLVGLLRLENRPLPPTGAPVRNCALFASLNAAPLALLDGLERLVRQVDAQAAHEMRARLAPLALPDGRTLDVRAAVESLRGPLTFSLGCASDSQRHSAQLLLTAGLRDPEALRGLLATLAQAFPAVLIPRPDSGANAYELRPVGLTVVVTAERVVCGTSAAAAHALGTQPAVAADARFERAAALATSEAWALAYVDWPRVFAAAHAAAVRRQTTTAPAGRPLELAAAELLDALVGTRASADALAELGRACGPTIITLATRPEGIGLSWIALPPAHEPPGSDVSEGSSPSPPGARRR